MCVVRLYEANMNRHAERKREFVSPQHSSSPGERGSLLKRTDTAIISSTMVSQTIPGGKDFAKGLFILDIKLPIQVLNQLFNRQVKQKVVHCSLTGANLIFNSRLWILCAKALHGKDLNQSRGTLATLSLLQWPAHCASSHTHKPHAEVTTD